MFDTFDINLDGYLTFEEVNEANLIVDNENITAQEFEELDLNLDGVIEFEEFVTLNVELTSESLSELTES